MGLRFHLIERVRENLQRDGTVGDYQEKISCESFIVGNAGQAHQGRIGREADNPGVLIQVEHSGAVGTIGENLDFQVRCFAHWLPFRVLKFGLLKDPGYGIR